MRYLLDTNIVSDLVRNPHGTVMERIREVGEEQIFTSIVVAAELRFGAKKKDSPRLTAQVEKVLTALLIQPLDVPADVSYGEIRTRLEQEGRIIGGHDLLIAAQALAEECTLVTDNERQFARVDGLRLENWLHSIR
ncbi:MAG: type II toxin-antitoxin system VapC family toxin [Trueperaceae bacterium]